MKKKMQKRKGGVEERGGAISKFPPCPDAQHWSGGHHFQIIDMWNASSKCVLFQLPKEIHCQIILLPVHHFVLHMCSQMICLNYPHCGFYNVSSDYAERMMQTYTGRIYSTFLHCVFSYDSLKHLADKSYSHTDYILWTFLHCVFANAFSECLEDKLHNHTGHICLTFPRHVFSSVSSNELPQMMHSHIVYIYMIFHQRVVSNVTLNDLSEWLHIRA